MKTYDNLLTLQLRPHLAIRLVQLRERTKVRMIAAGVDPARVARIKDSAIIRNLINASANNPTLSSAALRYALGVHTDPHSGETGYRVRVRNWMSPMVNLRVRLDAATLANLNGVCATATAMVPDYGRKVSQSRAIAGLIASAYFKDDVPKDDPDAEPIAADLIET